MNAVVPNSGKECYTALLLKMLSLLLCDADKLFVVQVIIRDLEGVRKVPTSNYDVELFIPFTRST